MKKSLFVILLAIGFSLKSFAYDPTNWNVTSVDSDAGYENVTYLSSTKRGNTY